MTCGDIVSALEFIQQFYKMFGFQFPVNFWVNKTINLQKFYSFIKQKNFINILSSYIRQLLWFVIYKFFACTQMNIWMSGGQLIYTNHIRYITNYKFSNNFAEFFLVFWCVVFSYRDIYVIFMKLWWHFIFSNIFSVLEAITDSVSHIKIKFTK